MKISCFKNGNYLFLSNENFQKIMLIKFIKIKEG